MRFKLAGWANPVPGAERRHIRGREDGRKKSLADTRLLRNDALNTGPFRFFRSSSWRFGGILKRDVVVGDAYVGVVGRVGGRALVVAGAG